MSVVSDEIPRPVRVVFPVQVAFSGATFKISESSVSRMSALGIQAPPLS